MTGAKMTKERLLWGRLHTLFVQTRRILCIGGLFIILLMTEQAHAERALPAFPGAEGYGSHTPGGRGENNPDIMVHELGFSRHRGCNWYYDTDLDRFLGDQAAPSFRWIPTWP